MKIKMCHFLQTIDISCMKDIPEEHVEQMIREAKDNLIKHLELFVRSYMLTVKKIPFTSHTRYEVSIPWLVSNNGRDLISEAINEGFDVERISHEMYAQCAYPEYNITLPEDKDE